MNASGYKFTVDSIDTTIKTQLAIRNQSHRHAKEKKSKYLMGVNDSASNTYSRKKRGLQVGVGAENEELGVTVEIG